MKIHETSLNDTGRLDLIGIPVLPLAVEKLNDSDLMIRIPTSAFCRLVHLVHGAQEWRGLKRIECLLGALTAEAHIASSHPSHPSSWAMLTVGGFQTKSLKWKSSIFSMFFKLFGESIPVINGLFQGKDGREL